ncbi:MAG: M56 family peptidase, partial [Microcystaceae cyanobacterium]
RELRADQKAVEKVDPLVLAESLLLVAQHNQQITHLSGLESICAAFQSERLTLRINGLLEPSSQSCLTNTAWAKLFWLLALIPLIFIPLHS